MFLLQGLEPCDEITPNPQRVFLEMLFLEYVENGESRGACDGIASECAEEFHSVIETCGDFRSGNDGRERERISDRFAEHNDVRDDSLRLESPEVRAEAAEADLHLIGDTDAACGADVVVSFGEIAGRKYDLAGDARAVFPRCRPRRRGLPRACS